VPGVLILRGGRGGLIVVISIISIIVSIEAGLRGEPGASIRGTGENLVLGDLGRV